MFLTIYNQQDKTFDFDVVGHHKANFHFVCIFPISFPGDGKEPQVTPPPPPLPTHYTHTHYGVCDEALFLCASGLYLIV